MLKQFTAPESLEGATYSCITCPRASLQHAHKQLLITQSPEVSPSLLPLSPPSNLAPDQVLRIHLKRFGWSGRTQHKINRHVSFPFQLDLQPFCAPPPPTSIQGDGEEEVGVVSTRGDCCLYQLSSVIVHHGTGFQSGHYTAYCWNSEAGTANTCHQLDNDCNVCAESWVHCNDARISRCSGKEVQNCQAYILFYTCVKGSEDDLDQDIMQQPVNKRRRTGN